MAPVQILLVEDSPDDIMLTEEALKDAKIANELNSVMDGEAALAYLRAEEPYTDRKLPALVILDLNLPKKDGRQVLQEIKSDDDLKQIPVVVLSTSAASEDISLSYRQHVNAYIQKPVDFDEFIRTVRTLEDFWLSVVKLPNNGN
jgi:CheY-like chemotaxis protein